MIEMNNIHKESRAEWILGNSELANHNRVSPKQPQEKAALQGSSE